MAKAIKKQAYCSNHQLIPNRT